MYQHCSYLIEHFHNEWEDHLFNSLGLNPHTKTTLLDTFFVGPKAYVLITN